MRTKRFLKYLPAAPDRTVSLRANYWTKVLAGMDSAKVVELDRTGVALNTAMLV
jgi:hypothetical protein